VSRRTCWKRHKAVKSRAICDEDSTVSAPALLEIAGLRRVYRRGGLFSRTLVAAVDDISLTLENEPRIFAIVGESGSGKTTLARMVLRLVEPSAGSIHLLGRPLSGKSRNRISDSEFRRLVQPIFQNPFEAFSDHLPMEHVLVRTALNLRIASNRTDAEEAADSALKAVGLGFGRIKGKYLRQFSGGELQRVAIARALIPRPRLIVADEPVSMVDASMRMNLVNLFLKIRDESGVSFIYITHDLSTAHYVADDVAIMNSGRVLEHGKPQHVLANPQNAYTRELLAAIPRVGERWPELQRLESEGPAGREATGSG
jgi:ABC-type oligopeptide transport system ATPase subunit